MKKFTAVTLALLFAASLTVQAQEKPKHKPTAEQKAFRKEMLEKYDANKDGKLDKDERSKMTQEDKDKMATLSPGKGKKHGAEGGDK